MAVEITADILDRAPGPALSSISDMPVISSEVPNAPELAPVGEAAATEVAPAEGGEGEVGAEGDAAADGEGGEAPVESAPAEPPRPRRIGPVQQRVHELTAEKKIEAARREAAEAHAARLEKLLADALGNRQQETARQEPAPPQPVEEPRPVRETFDSPDSYDEALIEWAATRAQQRGDVVRREADRVAKEAADREAADQAAATSFRAMQDTHMARRSAFVEAHPDYVDVAESDNVQISMPMGLAIINNDNGPAVAYYLGQHPDEAARIAGMIVPGQVFPPGHQMAGLPVPDTQRQLVEMGKIFATVAHQSAPPSPTPPPPAPINPIRRGGAPAVEKSLDDMTMEEYAAQRMPQLQAERRPGLRRVN